MRRRPLRLVLSGGAAAALALLGLGPGAPAGAAKATGDPIPIQFVNLDATSSTVPARQGVAAAVKEINHTGGIGGRPLVTTECLTDQTPETGTACADAAIAAGPAAVFAVQPGSASDSVPALTFAGIPYVAQTCNTSTTLGGQYSTFCFGSDFVGLYASSAAYLQTLGTVTAAVVPYVDVPAARTGIKAYAEPTLERAGITPAEAPIPEGSTDVAAAIQPVLDFIDADAVISLLAGPGCIGTMQLSAEQTTALPYVYPALCTDPDVVNDGGAGAKGSLFVRQTVALDKKNADVKTYRKAMARYSPKAETDDVYAQAGFAGIMNLAAALRRVPAGAPVDATSTAEALRAATQVPMFLTPGATYTCDGTAFPSLEAVCAIQSHVVEYRGKGKWTDKGLF
jgi:branched-chain amino acid transport system substrate-binding protein